MLSSALLAIHVPIALAATVTYDFDIGWTTAAPDGFERPVIGINGQWPLPVVECNVGDTVVVNAHNSLGNETTSLHWHGMYQKGTNIMDGSLGVAQCGIDPGSSYTYTFTADPAGTHWYHSHAAGQYPDGLRQIMIVHDPEWEESLGITDQLYITMSDWYHTQFPVLINDYLSPDNTDGTFASPDTFLFNDTRADPVWNFQPGKKYLIRIASVSAVACNVFHIDGYNLTVVGVDGVQTQPAPAESILICAGQRYEVVVDVPGNPHDSPQFISKGQTNMFTQGSPSPEQLAVIGQVVPGNMPTNSSNALQPTFQPANVLDDTTLKPLDMQPLYGPAGTCIDLGTNQTFFPGIGTRIAVGQQPWVLPKVPSLFTALTTGEDAYDASTYGVGTEPWILPGGDVIQVYYQNNHPYPHPIHLHGHEFQVAASGSGEWDGDQSNLTQIPLRRDVVFVEAGGYVVLRFLADNPGVWMFHCHIDLHLVGGMAAIFVEDIDTLQATQSISDDAKNICKSSNTSYSGNCAAEQGAISASDSADKCNTVLNTYYDGIPHGAVLAEPGTAPFR